MTAGRAGRLLGADLACQLEPVHVGHVDVGQDQGIGLPAPLHEAFDAVGGGVDRDAQDFELAGQDFEIDRIVVDRENPAFGDSAGRCRPRHALGDRPFGTGEVERDDEGRSPAGLAFDRDAAAHQLGQPAHDRKAEPGAAEAPGGRAVGLGKGLEQAGRLLGGDADAGVGDRQGEAHAVVGLRQGPDMDADLAHFGELDGIADQVEQDLAYPGGVAAQMIRRAGLDHGGDGEAAALGLDRQRLAGALDDGAQLERRLLQFHPAGLDLGEVEHVVDDAQQGRGRGAHRAHEALLAHVERLALEQLGGADDAVHGRADLVADGGEEGRLGLVGGLRRVAGRFKFGLPTLEFGDVAVESQRAAVLQGHVGILDMASTRQFALEAASVGIKDQRHAIFDRQNLAIHDHDIAGGNFCMQEVDDFLALSK